MCIYILSPDNSIRFPSKNHLIPLHHTIINMTFAQFPCAGTVPRSVPSARATWWMMCSTPCAANAGFAKRPSHSLRRRAGDRWPGRPATSRRISPSTTTRPGWAKGIYIKHTCNIYIYIHTYVYIYIWANPLRTNPGSLSNVGTQFADERGWPGNMFVWIVLPGLLQGPIFVGPWIMGVWNILGFVAWNLYQQHDDMKVHGKIHMMYGSLWKWCIPVSPNYTASKGKWWRLSNFWAPYFQTNLVRLGKYWAVWG